MKEGARKLLTVEDAFLIQGRGILVLPWITDYSGPMSFPVMLRKPNGKEIPAQAHLDIPRQEVPGKPYPFACSFPAMGMEEIPIGTEVWVLPDKS